MRVFIGNMGNREYFYLKFPSEFSLIGNAAFALDVGHAYQNQCLSAYRIQPDIITCMIAGEVRIRTMPLARKLLRITINPCKFVHLFVEGDPGKGGLIAILYYFFKEMITAERNSVIVPLLEILIYAGIFVRSQKQITGICLRESCCPIRICPFFPQCFIGITYNVVRQSATREPERQRVLITAIAQQNVFLIICLCDTARQCASLVRRKSRVQISA